MVQQLQSPQAFSKTLPFQPRIAERIKEPLYDFQWYPAAGAQQLQFFAAPAGSAGSQSSAPGVAAGVAKSMQDTNMVSASLLPAGMQFRVEGIEVVFFPGSNAALFNSANPFKYAADPTAAADANTPLMDIKTFYESGHLNLTVLQKPYLDVSPLGRFPPTMGLEINSAMSAVYAAAAAGINMSNNGIWRGIPFMFRPDQFITLTSGMNFSLTLTWPAALAMPSGFIGRVGVYLHGTKERLAQ